MLNVTFNNISVILWRSDLLVEEKTTDLSQVTNKCYHILLYLIDIKVSVISWKNVTCQEDKTSSIPRPRAPGKLISCILLPRTPMATPKGKNTKNCRPSRFHCKTNGRRSHSKALPHSGQRKNLVYNRSQGCKKYQKNLLKMQLNASG